jgi:predicted nucleic-acid-binding Zn-ribbon protein
MNAYLEQEIQCTNCGNKNYLRERVRSLADIGGDRRLHSVFVVMGCPLCDYAEYTFIEQQPATDNTGENEHD